MEKLRFMKRVKVSFKKQKKVHLTAKAERKFEIARMIIGKLTMMDKCNLTLDNVTLFLSHLLPFKAFV